MTYVSAGRWRVHGKGDGRKTTSCSKSASPYRGRQPLPPLPAAAAPSGEDVPLAAATAPSGEDLGLKEAVLSSMLKRRERPDKEPCDLKSTGISGR
eukprot:1657623-Rhodomonas_salina.1